MKINLNPVIRNLMRMDNVKAIYLKLVKRGGTMWHSVMGHLMTNWPDQPICTDWHREALGTRGTA